jgi:hypothetical protein
MVKGTDKTTLSDGVLCTRWSHQREVLGTRSIDIHTRVFI